MAALRVRLPRMVGVSRGMFIGPTSSSYCSAASELSRPSLSEDDFKYCLDQVKLADYWHWYCGGYLPAGDKRNCYFALRALNLELLANEPGPAMNDTQHQMHVEGKAEARALVRLDWWRQAINKCYEERAVAPNETEKIPSHPVVRAVHYAVREHPLSKTWFSSLLRARKQSVEQLQPSTMAELEQYADDTAGSLMRLTLEMMTTGKEKVSSGEQSDRDHAASHAGRAVGMAFLLRSTIDQLKARKCFLPMANTASHGISTERLFKGERSQELSNVVYEVACVANEHARLGRSMAANMERECRQAMLPLVVAENFLATLQQADFDLFEGKLYHPVERIKAQLSIQKAAWFGM